MCAVPTGWHVGRTVKALTVRQPWAWAILHAGKRIENRTRRTNYRGRFYIHAGLAVPGWPPLADVETRCGRMPYVHDLIYGHIIGTAELMDCVWSDTLVSPWGEPQAWHWHLANVKPLREPIPARGQLGLWEYAP